MATPKITRRVLIAVPTFEEAENIEPLMRGIERHAPKVHVLFVDDHSPDGTREAIEALRREAPERIHLIERPQKLGLGSAYVSAFQWALARGYDAVVEMDADLSHDPGQLPLLIELLGSEDVVVGSRYVSGGGTRNWSPIRRLISRGGCIYARWILGMPIRDLTGGFNGWRREVLEALDLRSVRSDGYSFQIELKYKAYRAGFSIREMPIVFVERRAGSSKMSGGIVWEAVFRVWTLRFRGSRP